MVKNNTNRALYILAVIIVLVSASYVYSRVSHFSEVRRAEAARAVAMETHHQLVFIANEIHYSGTEFVATVQVSDMQGQPIKASLSGVSDNVIWSFDTDYYGNGTIAVPLRRTGRRQILEILVESEIGSEHFRKTINIAEFDDQNLIIHFDKGLYKPGDDVLFRILAVNSTTARPLVSYPYTISIFDGNDNRVFHEDVFSSEFGIISGRFRLAEEVNSGFYRLVVEQDRTIKAETHFEVQPFVLPRFEINLETDKTEYNVGETIYLVGNVQYFFGEPVNQGHVNVFINGELELANATLDENGGFTLNHITHAPGLFNIWVEVIDNSNYRVETTLSVRASEGAFEIDLMPEHGYLVQGMPNTVYVFTHRADGTPVRTLLQITGRTFSRQVATDDNGIGTFLLEDVELRNSIFVRAMDMNDNVVEQNFIFDGFARNITLSTDRPRYAMGDTIRLSLNSRETDGIFKIYAYRNDRLLQIITTEYDWAELNLGDVYGLIDIYAVWIGSNNFRYAEHLSHARRTIFIDPGSFMQLNLQSDRPEYRPGEFVNLSIGVTDDRGNPLEAALLVSIVDEAMLSLAANDLSIDNIRIALADIRFGEDLDAATLYASLIAGASEQAITRLLLRQGEATPFIHTVSLVNNLPRVPRDINGAQRALNLLRIYILILATVFFFVFWSRKRRELKATSDILNDLPSMTDMSNLPNTPVIYTTSPSQRKGWAAMWSVLISIAVVILVLIFLTSCGSNNEPSSAPRPPAATENQAAPAPGGAALAPPAPAPQMPALPPSDSAPAAMPDSWDASAVAEPTEVIQRPVEEIETQTARVRRLFLETMLFIPELVARDGQADLGFMLADNITTWNIQIVGNTRDGLIGHTQGSIRAFQPFFVDFELPRNSVRYDQISIPVTVFNYTEDEQTVILTIAEMDWFTLHTSPVQTLVVPSNQSQMVYVPITIVQFGDFVFRAYADTHGFADAAERGLRVNPEGFRINQIVSSGTIENSTWQHLLFIQEDIPDTRNAIIKFYPSTMSQLIEGMENIFRMPHGCFEQISSTLYPNILALRYMQENNLDNPQLTQTALGFISSGYQRLLTYEVRTERGGFSLFGRAPAETVLTAYGLMQLKDLTSVYTIDERVLDRMANFLFSHQNRDGSFEITGRHRHSNSESQRLAFNAYIVWALSEAFPEDPRLYSAVDYLVSTLNSVDDNYTLALIANVLVNTRHPLASEVVNKLHGNVIRTGETAHITSTTRDFLGASGRMQNLQTTALTSLALSRHGSHSTTNDLLINYIIAQRDAWGTWHSTQATILSLKALTSYSMQAPLQDGLITVSIGEEQHVIEIIHRNTLDFYQVSFNGLERENIVNIHFPDLGRMFYQIVVEYFAPYDSVELNRGFEITSHMRTELAIHEWVEQEIRIVNDSGDMVNNALVAVSIPQGFRVEQSSLAMLRHQGIIERYETRFDNINLYLRDVEAGEVIYLAIAYRPSFPVNVTGGHVRVFDYYNPTIEGFLRPVEITVQ